jgi:hypothetical protein
MIRKDNLRPVVLLTLPSSEYRLGIIEAFWIAGPASSHRISENANICMKLTPKYNFVFPHQLPGRQFDGPN